LLLLLLNPYSVFYNNVMLPLLISCRQGQLRKLDLLLLLLLLRV
jgi:hypothetical protein